MLIIAIIVVALGVAFTGFGYSICFLKKYNLINGFEEQKRQGIKTDEYAQRVGHVELIIGIVCIAAGILLIVIRNRNEMELWQIIGGIILFALSMILMMYASFTARQKGPIISNTYLLFSEQERRRMNVDRQKEYRVVTIAYGLMSIAIYCMALHFFSSMGIMLIIGIAILVIDAIWAVVSTIKYG